MVSTNANANKGGLQTITTEPQLTSAPKRSERSPEQVAEHARQTKVDEERSLQQPSGRRLAHHIGALQPAHVGRNNPIIEVIGTRGATSTTRPEQNVVGRFEEFILSSAQEQDAEKGFVVETFGAPYFFATGRFTQKFTFSGKLRTTPVNHQARGASIRDQRLATPQFQLFRLFYDKYLRMSEQVKYGRYTRITVDGEVYEGYVSTMNLGREATVETVADFTFTFIGTNRSSARHEQSAGNILELLRPAKNEQPAMPTSVAQAELKDALGDLELLVTLERDGTNTSSVASTQKRGITRENTDLSKYATVSLIAKGTPQVLRVQTAAQGVDIVYRHKTAAGGNSSGGGQVAVHNSLATITGEGGVGRAMDLRVTSYRALFNYLLAEKGSSDPNSTTLDDHGQVVSGAVEFKILTDVAEPVTVIYNITLDGREIWEISSMKVTMANANKSAPMPSSDALHYRDQTGFIGYTDGGTPGAVDTGNIIPFTFTIKVLDGAGQKLDQEVFNHAAEFLVKKVRANATIGVSGHIATDDSVGSTRIDAKIQGVPTIIGNAQLSEYEVSGNIHVTKINGGAQQDLTVKDSYTFTAADRILVEVEFDLGIPGHAPSTAVREAGGYQTASFMLIGAKADAADLLRTAVPSVRTYDAVRGQVSPGGSPLVSMGRLQFQLVTDAPLAADALAVIRESASIKLEMKDVDGPGGPGGFTRLALNGTHQRLRFPVAAVGSTFGISHYPTTEDHLDIDVQVAVFGGTPNTGSPYAISRRTDFNFIRTNTLGRSKAIYVVEIDFTVATNHNYSTDGSSISGNAIVKGTPDAYRLYVERYLKVTLDLSKTGLGSQEISVKGRA